MASDPHLFCHENILQQLKSAEFRNGYYVLEFYIDEKHKPSGVSTGNTAKFYLYPSGGTLRDSNFQLISYNSSYDTYRGFRPPERGTT